MTQFSAIPIPSDMGMLVQFRATAPKHGHFETLHVGYAVVMLPSLETDFRVVCVEHVDLFVQG